MIKLTRSQLRHLILETSKFGEDIFDKDRNPEKYRSEYIDRLVANGEISAEHGETLKELDIDVESREQVESFLQTLIDKESLGSDFVDQELLDNIDAGIKDELIASVVEFSQRYDAGGEARWTEMKKLFKSGAITNEELDKIEKIMRVVPGTKQWYTAPTLRPDRIDAMYSYGNRPNTDIAVYFQQLKAYYYNAREASSYDDMKHEGYIYPHASMIGDISTQINQLCEDVVKQGMAVKLYLNQMALYIFDPMWVQSNTMLDIGAKDRKKVMAHMSELISQQRKKMDPTRRI